MLSQCAPRRLGHVPGIALALSLLASGCLVEIRPATIGRLAARLPRRQHPGCGLFHDAGPWLYKCRSLQHVHR